MTTTSTCRRFAARSGATSRSRARIRGREALELSADASFDVALVDYAMPGMNGVDFCVRARALRADFCHDGHRARGPGRSRDALDERLGAAVIMKPYDREGVLRWVLALPPDGGDAKDGRAR